VTELAYLADVPAAYVRTFRAHVVALPPGGVVLDRTFFYPTGGGQPSDRGSLRSGETTVEVTDVTRSGTAVHHRVRAAASDARAWRVGAEVEGNVDWERRHQHMRLHTGQHVLSARTFERSGLRTRKAVLRGLGATIDLEGELPSSHLEEIGGDLRGIVRANRAVSVRYVARAEWESMPSAGRSGLVPLPPQVDPVRLVEVDQEDRCPCGGTHVRATGEIGEFRLTPPVLTPDGGTRIGFTLERPGATVPTA
jgi:misacylated tRNA(Ala) deacylase